jgi:glutathione synthase/RimK-type ligase-like ATP-grasp enzyme
MIKELNSLIKDPIYVIDICLTDKDEYKVLELNSFSCSGLYDCNPNIIVYVVESIIKIKESN